MTDRAEMPKIPAERLDAGGWSLTESTTETLFELLGLRVLGETALYEDADLRAALAAADDALDMPWRFFFATRLVFRPSLAPGIGPATLLPTVAREARRTFATDLEDRGFRDVNRGRTQGDRTRSGERLRLTKYTARYTVESVDLDIEGWVGIWIENGMFRLAGGAYPTQGFEKLLAATDSQQITDPKAYRSDLLDLIRG